MQKGEGVLFSLYNSFLLDIKTQIVDKTHFDHLLIELLTTTIGVYNLG